MRALAVLALACASFGCTAITPFKFQFTDGGGAAADLRPDDGGAPADLTPLGPGAFGEACTPGGAGCLQYAAIGTRPTTCETQFGNATFPGNMCTRICDDTILASCSDYAAVGHGARCIRPSSGGGDPLCLARCAPTLGFNCRKGFVCCNNMGPTTGEGVCIPGC